VSFCSLPAVYLKWEFVQTESTVTMTLDDLMLALVLLRFAQVFKFLLGSSVLKSRDRFLM
jgi:hypothetical protein